jgi:hypothetical protein
MQLVADWSIVVWPVKYSNTRQVEGSKPSTVNAAQVRTRPLTRSGVGPIGFSLACAGHPMPDAPGSMSAREHK